MPDTSVKRIHESMRGAPVLNGVAGSLIGLLDTFLVNGWGLATANSLSVSGGVATLTMPAGSGFEDHCVVLIAGATPAALNGEQRIATTNGTTLTFPTTVADGPATGTITVKYAACGWEKVFSGANLAVYRSLNAVGNRRFLRVRDTGTVDARVVAYNSMADVNTGTGQFPTNAQMSGGGYWIKAPSSGTSSQRYDLFGDDRFFIFAPAPMLAAYGGNMDYCGTIPRAFGDPISLSPTGDAWSTILTTGVYAADYSSTQGSLCHTRVPGVWHERSSSGAGAPVETYVYPMSGRVDTSLTSGSTTDGTHGTYPSSVSGRLLYTRLRTSVSQTDATSRTLVPGIYFIPQDIPQGTVLNPRDTVPGSETGRRLMLLPLVSSSTRPAMALVDITGPWR